VNYRILDRTLPTITKFIAAILLAITLVAGINSTASAAAHTQSEDQCLSSRPPLRPGDTGTCVRALQRVLAEKGVFTITSRTDSTYGPLTQKAVNRFQSQNGLPHGGVGTRTWEKLLGNSTNVRPAANVAPAGNTGNLPAACNHGSAKVICVVKGSGSRAELYAIENNNGNRRIVQQMPARTGDGRPGDFDTHDGVHKIFWKHQDHVSSIYNSPMPDSLFFYGDQAIHYSGDFARNGYGGLKHSHGCVNIGYKVGRAGSKQLFAWADYATRVVVTR
jgi:peptidoglycan hydrolase-like protein with peptidoglycan-binding domain